VLVDYAHTPDALRRVLEAVRGLTRGGVHCVFGCGGDRDPKKRPKMGEAARAAATRITITNDNPRSEDPAAIAAAIELGLWGAETPYEIVLDRHVAIENAIVGAAPGDLILIAGKGHEPYQIIGAEKRAFDDRVEARRALAKRRGETP
jgi:UDP-N-acetylmuramoyl-L-alanyl-D-glutamate--2,6-diaminopimelate ligase